MTFSPPLAQFRSERNLGDGAIEMGERPVRLILLLTTALLAAGTSAAAENWQPVAGEADTYVDLDFVKIDQQSGLIVLRTAIGKKSGATFDEWTERDAIMLSAVDCKSDTYKDLGIDLDGNKGPPEGWRGRPSHPGAKMAVGGASVTACKMRDTLPKVTLP
jgi:hypothetical protein